MTEIPLVYTVGFMAVDKRAFSKLSEADQQVVRDVMLETYEKFDGANLEDNREARDALLNAGIASVPFDAAEVAKLRERLLESNRHLGSEGAFNLALYDEMMGYVQEYREAKSAATAETQ
jgi:TRAP-type C4-dicarboxylate transport system substrate-binding protein